MLTSLDSVHAKPPRDKFRVPQWRVDEERQLRGFAVEWAEPGLLLLSRGNRLYQTPSISKSPSLMAKCPSVVGTFAARLRIAQRALRQLYYNVLRLPSGEVFVTYGRRIGVLRGDRFHTVTGLHRSCRVLRGACAVDAEGTVYFGEYMRNAERGAIRVYRLAPGENTARVVHTFKAGEVRHVHGIYYDPNDASLWTLTGDRKDECKVLRTVDAFQTLEVVGQGDETWRAVSALFTADAVYYGMDAEFCSNRIFRLDKQTGKRVELGEVDGPVYYSTSVGDDLFFGVAAEMCPSQVGRNATLWQVDAHDELSRVVSHEKDYLSRHFMPGTLHFPSGPGLPNHLLYHGVALSGADNRTFSVRRSSESHEAIKHAA